MSYYDNAKQAIPAEIRMISGCKDAQTSADVSDVASFQLPDPAGRAGGALTSSLLKVFWQMEKCYFQRWPHLLALLSFVSHRSHHFILSCYLISKVLYADQRKPDVDLSFQELLLKVRDVISEGEFEQIPQLSSSRPLDITHPFEIVPEGSTGVRRALLIGINYVGQQVNDTAKQWILYGNFLSQGNVLELHSTFHESRNFEICLFSNPHRESLVVATMMS